MSTPSNVTAVMMMTIAAAAASGEIVATAAKAQTASKPIVPVVAMAPAAALSAPPAVLPAGPPADWRPAPDRWAHAEGYRVTGLTVSPSGAGCRGGNTYINARYQADKGFTLHAYAAATAADGGIVCTNGIWYHSAGPLKGQSGGSVPDVLIKNGKYFYKR